MAENPSNPGSYTIIPLKCNNGVQRDGTKYDSQSYIDAQWNRFYEGVPVMMGGCQVLFPGENEVIGTMLGFSLSDKLYVYYATYSNLKFFVLQRGTTVVQNNVDITPAPTNWNPSDINNLWTMSIYSFTDNTTGILSTYSYIFAHVSAQRTDIASSAAGPIFYLPAATGGTPTQVLAIVGYNGSEDDAVPIIEPLTVTGGIIFVSPVMVAYGDNGTIFWNDNTDPVGSAWPIAPFTGSSSLPATPGNSAVIASAKIVTAATSRGGVLFWTLDELVRSEFGSVTAQVGGQTVTYSTFSSQSVQTNISILGKNSVVQYDQMFYWPGVDQLYYYNGIVNTLPNNTNNDWFFNNINTAAAQKIFGTVVPRFKELWWFYPRLPFTPAEGGDMSDQENNAVLIYNLAEQSYYDCTIPPDAPREGVYPWTRSAGIRSSANFPYPIWADNTVVPIRTGGISQPSIPIWMHEYGTDYVISAEQRYAIPAYFQTKLFDLWSANPQSSNLMFTWRVVLDFLQTNDMTLTISVQEYPNSVPEYYGPYLFNNNPAAENYQKYIDLDIQAPLTSFIFASNITGGSYHMGKPLLYIAEGDPFI